MAIIFDRTICRDIERALELEWLVTNGLGGYAASTIVGANTRRYHGILVAAVNSPRERLVLLSKVDEEVEADGVPYYLGTNEYTPATIHPCGFVHLEEFRLEDGLPVWTFCGGEWVLEKRLWMAYGQNTTYISYTLTRSPYPVTLTLRPLVNYRSFHRETKGRVDWDFAHVETDERGCCVLRAFAGAHPYALRSVPQMEHIPTGVWYWNFLHRRERERGLDYTEDLYAPGVLRRSLAVGDSVVLVASSEPPGQVDLNGSRVLEAERARRRELLTGSNVLGERDEVQQLVLAADQFIVQRAPTRVGYMPYGAGAVTVIAGYPWFGDWGRDTMIALPGLMLATRRYNEAAAVLRTYSHYVDQGMVPNRFPESGDIAPVEAAAVLRTYSHYVDQGMVPNRFPESGETPEYNTVDATLWFFVALWAYVQETEDLDLAGELYPLLIDIIEWHIRGTRYGIQVDPADGLLRAGVPGTQLTWMDAKVEDWVVTPRHGKPVEVNALWYNALRIVEELGRRLGKRAGRKRCRELAKQVEHSFFERFWYATGGYLYDVVDGPAGDDAALRPNQLFALSLPFPLLSGSEAESVLRVVDDELVTPYGLRSLAPKDPAYHGRCEGDIWQRDSAYHQGTVWSWLIGPYLTAVRRVFGPETNVRLKLEPLLRHLGDAGIGSISEILDGDAPHSPRGCFAQAWSVAEVLRLWRESAS